MGLYARYILPCLMERSLRRVHFLRAAALAPAHGEVLEVGFGSALNLAYYPESVRSLTALEPSPGSDARAARRIAQSPVPVERVRVRADESLPFADGRFDCIVTTWTLCSIADPLAALLEMRRVLRAEGLYLFLEHGRSEDARTARWQERITPLQRRLCAGCRLDLEIDALVRKAGFALVGLDRFVPPRTPRIWGTMYRGQARPA
jgi:ubiquinone/menaquinone biosynthesis C-methylase UbiE